MDLRATKSLSSERQDSMLESCTWTYRSAANKDSRVRIQIFFIENV